MPNREHSEGQYHRQSPNLPLAMEKITLLIRSISARQGFEIIPHFSTVYAVVSWAQLDRVIAQNPTMKTDPDALIMVHGGINERHVTFAGTVAIHGGINEGTIEAKRVITHDTSIGWGELDHSGNASGKASAKGKEEQRLLEEAFSAAFPPLERRGAHQSHPKNSVESADDLPTGAEAVRGAEEFLRRARDNE